MAARFELPVIGATVEALRPGAHELADFELAEVVNQLHDDAIGDVIEVEFEDKRRMQRVWPSPALRTPPPPAAI